MRFVGAVVVALALAPGASAGEFRFIGSDGTDCVVTTAPSKTLQPDGLVTVDTRASLDCDRRVFAYFFAVDIERKSPRWTYWDATEASGCNEYSYLNEICDTWPVDIHGTLADLPSDDYQQITRVTLMYEPGSQPPVPPAWVVVPLHQARLVEPRYSPPVHTDCKPGYPYVSCHFAEDAR
jgi:hypothetical protein